jgi:hypothetical protein
MAGAAAVVYMWRTLTRSIFRPLESAELGGWMLEYGFE